MKTGLAGSLDIWTCSEDCVASVSASDRTGSRSSVRSAVIAQGSCPCSHLASNDIHPSSPASLIRMVLARLRFAGSCACTLISVNAVLLPALGWLSPAFGEVGLSRCFLSTGCLTKVHSLPVCAHSMQGLPCSKMAHLDRFLRQASHGRCLRLRKGRRPVKPFDAPVMCEAAANLWTSAGCDGERDAMVHFVLVPHGREGEARRSECINLSQMSSVARISLCSRTRRVMRISRIVQVVHNHLSYIRTGGAWSIYDLII